MDAFLDRLAQAMLAHHGTALDKVAVVLPSQRAARYLRSALALHAGAALWSPELLTLSGLAERMTGLRTATTEEILLTAYTAYARIEASGRPLDEFLRWATTMVHDISEADAHLVPLDKFYRDLRSWEELDWSFNSDPLSPGQERMVSYWRLVAQVHPALISALRTAKAGTAGSVERFAAEEGNVPPWTALWCAGLNALNPAETRMVERCGAAMPLHFNWDADRYYLDAKHQEAGLYLRRSIAKFGPGAMPPLERIGKEDRHIHVLRTPNDVTQAWTAAELLADLSPQERSGTTLLLADTSLLPELLEALPAEIPAVNVTMGLAMDKLPVGTLLRSYLTLHQNYRADRGFVVPDLLRFLGHPMLKPGALGRSVLRLSKYLNELQRLYVNDADLQLYASSPLPNDEPDLSTWTQPCRSAHDLAQSAAAMLAFCREQRASDPFANEQLFRTGEVLQRVAELLGTHLAHIELRTYDDILGKILQHTEVGLFGDPLEGVQIMGMLETRALDARHVIVLGAQEGTLPADTNGSSFIPLELRRAYGMPLRDAADAVQAYNFMRLLHGAERITLIRTDSERSEGASRFEHQLVHAGAAAKIHVTTATVRIPMPKRTPTTLTLYADERARKKVAERMARGLSPSRIGEWLRCPLDFHLRRAIGLSTNEQPGVRIPDHVLGAALHKALEDTYKPWVGKPLEAASIRAALPMLEEHLTQALISNHASEAVSGQPYLQTRMALEATRSFLRNEAMAAEQSAIVPLELEMELEATVPDPDAVLPGPLKILGRLDRVDSRDGIVHILDLKSGSTEASALELSALDLDSIRGRKQYAAQLLVYAWLYLKNNPEVDKLRAGLLPLRQTGSSAGLYLRIAKSDIIQRSMLPEIEALLLDIGRSMLAPDSPIQHDPESLFCALCAKPLD